MELPDDKRPAIMDAIYAGASRKIEAIKLVREATGCGLREAKEFVEDLGDELYAREPQKFASPPSRSKGCVGLLAVVALVTVGVIVVTKNFS